MLLSQHDGEAFALCVDDKAISRDVYLGGTHDFAKVEAVLELLGKNRCHDLLIDIGANIGVICIPAVKRGLFKSAIAFEPAPRTFDLLKANIYLNGLATQIIAHNIALGDQNRQQKVLTLSKDNHGDNRIQSDNKSEPGVFGEEARETVTVRSETLDSAITINPSISALIWIDTQGFEGFVLAGAARALQCRPPLVAEFWPYGMNRSGSFEVMKTSLQAAGYESFVDLAAPSATIRLSAESLDELYDRIGESGDYTDILIR